MGYGDSLGRRGGLHRGPAGRLRALKEAAGEVLPLPLWGARLCRLGAVSGGAGGGTWALPPRWAGAGAREVCQALCWSVISFSPKKEKKKKNYIIFDRGCLFVVVWLCLFLVLFSNHQVGILVEAVVCRDEFSAAPTDL